MSIRALTVTAALLAVTSSHLPAETPTYLLEFPAGRKVHFRVPFRVNHAGRIELTIEWTGPTVLSFRVSGPTGDPPAHRRTGSSPQLIGFDVDAAATGEWSMIVRGLPSRNAGAASVTILAPEPADPAALPEPDEHVARAAPDEPWLAPREPPGPGAPATLQRLARAREAFRSALIAQDAPADTCRWQHDFLHFATKRLDVVVGGGAAVDVPTGELLARMAAAVESVAGLRETREGVLVAPPPSSAAARRAWQRARKERLRPYRRALDSITEALDRDYAPMLRRESWGRRFVGCLTACERHFEERAQIGGEAAAHGRLARDQWPRIVDAAELLRALSTIRGDAR